MAFRSTTAKVERRGEEGTEEEETRDGDATDRDDDGGGRTDEVIARRPGQYAGS